MSKETVVAKSLVSQTNKPYEKNIITTKKKSTSQKRSNNSMKQIAKVFKKTKAKSLINNKLLLKIMTSQIS